MTGVILITCCYCGAREMLANAKGARRVLSCQKCGAPLKRLETIKAATAPAKAPPPKGGWRRKPRPQEAARRKKKRKSFFARVIDDLDDLDDLFDIDDWFD